MSVKGGLSVTLYVRLNVCLLPPFRPDPPLVSKSQRFSHLVSCASYTDTCTHTHTYFSSFLQSLFALVMVRYEVVEKKKDALGSIRDTLVSRFTDRQRSRVQCGIIYCLSRNDCEKVANDLREMFKVCAVRTVPCTLDLLCLQTLHRLCTLALPCLVYRPYTFQLPEVCALTAPKEPSCPGILCMLSSCL